MGQAFLKELVIFSGTLLALITLLIVVGAFVPVRETIVVIPPQQGELVDVSATATAPPSQLAEKEAAGNFLEKEVEESAPLVSGQEESAAVSETEPTPPPPVTVEPIPSAPLTIFNPQFAILAQNARSTVVNILCSRREGNTIQTITGSGVVIDSRGVILTNAHVAQHFLLKNYPKKNATTCIIRGGNPARPLYQADILYIPPVWIEENAGAVALEVAFGTGEHDYAFLRVSGGLSEGQTLPASFPAASLTLEEAAADLGEPVFVTAYPADIFTLDPSTENLYSTSDISKVLEYFTYEQTTPDLFSLDSSIVSQKGSSGGAVIRDDGDLIGLIVTSTDNAVLTKRSLRAITLDYINRDLLRQTGAGLNTLLAGDVGLKTDLFNDTVAPRLTQLLTAVLAEAAE